MLFRRLFHLIVIFLVMATCVTLFLTYFDIRAVNGPGLGETYLVTKAKRWFVRRDVRGSVPEELSSDAASISQGSTIFGGECASCHGQDGRTPSDFGKSMYPRVPDLGSKEVQQWSNEELFWIVRNGIRMSGMPGFAKILDDKQTWAIVHFIRTLPRNEKKTK